jgi:DNA-binding PadR family transcriptional regulator
VNPSPFRSQLDLLLLAVLAPGPLHGYAVIDRLRAASGGLFDLPEGTVYPVLHRLEREGLLASGWGDRQGRRTRTYRLTAAGVRALREKQADWLGYRRGVESVLEGSV